ncbi:MAG: hypothetical protein ACRDWY_07385, partial [Actinomycetes bacterium]
CDLEVAAGSERSGRRLSSSGDALDEPNRVRVQHALRASARLAIRPTGTQPLSSPSNDITVGVEDATSADRIEGGGEALRPHDRETLPASTFEPDTSAFDASGSGDYSNDQRLSTWIPRFPSRAGQFNAVTPY